MLDTRRFTFAQVLPRPVSQCAEIKAMPSSAHGSACSEASFGMKGSASSPRCKWCLRDFSSANPLKNHKCPTLPRKEGSLQCDICLNVLAWGCKGVDKKALLGKMVQFSETRKEFIGEVNEWVDMQNTGRRNPKKKQERQADGDGKTFAMPTLHKSVEREKATVIEVRESLGVLWPVPIYKQLVGGNLPKVRGRAKLFKSFCNCACVFHIPPTAPLGRSPRPTE